MARIEEQVRKIQHELRDQPEAMREAIASLHAKDAARVITGVIPSAPMAKKDWKDSLLQTAAGQQAIQLKVDLAAAKLNDAERKAQERQDIAVRIRQLKELVHDTFVVMPRSAEPINGWKPRVRFDLYQGSKESCRVIGEEGGEQYEKVVTAVRYALTGSKAYRNAIEVLGI